MVVVGVWAFPDVPYSADDDIGLGRIEEFELALRLARQPFVVIVEKSDYIGPHMIKSAVQCSWMSAVVLDDMCQLLVSGSEFETRTMRGSVVDQDDVDQPL
jgi:hypothetical protein